MIRFFYIPLLVAAFLLPTSSFSKTSPRYLVKVEKGEVLVWPVWSTKWRRIKESAKLNQGTLIQIRNGSVATIVDKRPSSLSGITAEQIHLTIRTPSVIRLDETNLRKIRLKPFYIDTLPELADSSESKGENFFLPLKEAWERFSVVFTGDPGKQLAAMDMSKLSDRDDTEIAVKSNKIRLHLPADGAIVSSEYFPVKIALQWNHKKPKKPLKYLVSVWNAGEFQKKPVALTRAKYYSLNIAQQGEYKIQITSTDNKWASKIQTFLATLPKNRQNKHLQADNNTKLLSPPDGLDLVTSDKVGTINFEWQSPDIGTPKEFFLVVKDDEGKELIRKNVRQRFFSTDLPYGHYAWHIESKESVLDDDPKLYVTDIRSLTITSDSRSYYSKILKKSTDSTVYLENGL